MSSSDGKLVHNLEKQLERLVEQIHDLEECKNEISEDEYDLMKEETQEQILEFELTLEKLQKGDMTLDSRVSMMKAAIRTAISNSFNTNDLKQTFEAHDNLDQQLLRLEEKFRLKKLDQSTFFNEKSKILDQILGQGRNISDENLEFLKRHQENPFFNALEKIDN